jgi:hypothetical protein
MRAEMPPAATKGPVLVRVKGAAETRPDAANTPVLVRRTIPEYGPQWRERLTQINRRVFSLPGASLVCILLIMSQIQYFVHQRRLNERALKASLHEITRLDDSQSPVGMADPLPFSRTIVAASPPPKPRLKTPVNRLLAGMHLPLVVPGPQVSPTKRIDVPAPDIASVSSPDRYALDRNLSDLPLAPPIVPAYAPAMAVNSSGKTSADANAVIEALEKYSKAWNTKRVAQITALRPGLPRRTVQEELSSTSSLVMRIQPTSAPRIQGDHATVECIHQVDQVFTDGIKKQNPGVKMTYVLVRRGDNWLIEESR